MFYHYEHFHKIKKELRSFLYIMISSLSSFFFFFSSAQTWQNSIQYSTIWRPHISKWKIMLHEIPFHKLESLAHSQDSRFHSSLVTNVYSAFGRSISSTSVKVIIGRKNFKVMLEEVASSKGCSTFLLCKQLHFYA